MSERASDRTIRFGKLLNVVLQFSRRWIACALWVCVCSQFKQRFANANFTHTKSQLLWMCITSHCRFDSSVGCRTLSTLTHAIDFASNKSHFRYKFDSKQIFRCIHNSYNVTLRYTLHQLRYLMTIRLWGRAWSREKNEWALLTEQEKKGKKAIECGRGR